MVVVSTTYVWQNKYYQQVGIRKQLGAYARPRLLVLLLLLAGGARLLLWLLLLVGLLMLLLLCLLLLLLLARQFLVLEQLPDCLALL